MSRALGGLGVIAMLAPLCGGVIVQWIDWHAALLVLSMFGAVTLAIVAWRFEETVPARNPDATRLAPLLANWAAVARHPGFRAWAALSPDLRRVLRLPRRVVVRLHRRARHLARRRTARRWRRTRSPTSSARCCAGGCSRARPAPHGGAGRGVHAAGGLAMALLSLAGWHAVWAVLVPQWAYAVGHGIHQPCGQVGAIGPFPDKAGTAAACRASR
jgi:DHA1 family bicyclomycin/chloramphenicol resistance-like MFS transporter